MGWTPLFEATQFDTTAAVSGLAACKANIDAFGPTLTTALQSAVAKEDQTMMTTLLEAGASTVCTQLLLRSSARGRVLLLTTT